ncbi:MAG: 50S ribosomal protein L6 [Candidatus Marinimicrobia bacterium]|nr:50S ribosomal protein L6 [Candidatus Neomarinimicrobiota bacterium]MCK9559456.1 50S ribosomal protein L6 [Candidatus Neomarinimicrobiota bacterium]MDD5061136.1 50S ribosomal protein L6 [Candidatus Neomarinimicrobiota bacterium]MDD5229926.1 50S ribosomal protein L6 [Candidatus Neomarinimicrobiota bacterium]MDD5539193.1 50S ribosomal protein L6 [Candidatus Neomarinimicrobiota bacterium]
MSRIGKKPIEIPNGVNVTIKDCTISVKSPKGELTWDFPADMNVQMAENQILVTRPSDSRGHRALHGLTRMMIANMVEGVSKGFSKTLEIEGVGYSAELKGNSVEINVGMSHSILVTPPDGVSFEIPKALNVTVKGIDKQKVGQIAAKIRSIKPSEPYKGKGIRYVGEHVRRKAGKKVGVK